MKIRRIAFLGLALALCSCALNAPVESGAKEGTPEEDLASVKAAYEKSHHIFVTEPDEWGHTLHVDEPVADFAKAVEIWYWDSTRYFDSSFRELEKEEFDQGESFYVYWEMCNSSYPPIWHAIYCFEA